MARIVGVELEDKWRVDYALTHIKGIGWSLSQKILDSLKIEKNTRVAKLTRTQISHIAGEIDKYLIEGELVSKVRANIQRLKTIGAYKGIRHTRGLPARGQRTRSNARTKRGKRKTIGAYKKEALSKIKQTTTKKGVKADEKE
jgi:small subunit ribosomal protein S13